MINILISYLEGDWGDHDGLQFTVLVNVTLHF